MKAKFNGFTIASRIWRQVLNKCLGFIILKRTGRDLNSNYQLSWHAHCNSDECLRSRLLDAQKSQANSHLTALHWLNFNSNVCLGVEILHDVDLKSSCSVISTRRWIYCFAKAGISVQPFDKGREGCSSVAPDVWLEKNEKKKIEKS